MTHHPILYWFNYITFFGSSQAKQVMSTHIWRFFQDRFILEDVYQYAKNN